jgi:hypothetical protein
VVFEKDEAVEDALGRDDEDEDEDAPFKSIE